MKLAIVIPAYNESDSIVQVLTSLPKKVPGIKTIATVVVDDGSKDQTYARAKKHATYAVSNLINMGVGVATITGLEIAKKIGADIVVTMDADGQHHPSDIQAIIKPILQNQADVVIGTRMLNSRGMPFIKVFGNWVMNFLTLLVYHQWTSDSQSGMKAINNVALKKIKLYSIGYEICSEIIGEVKRNRLRLKEIPIKVLYSDYSKAKGQSFINAINIFTKSLIIRLSGKK